MASPSSTGTSSGSGSLQISDETDPHHTTTDIRKRKRMLSNRESARRSRMRKQQHLDDLTAQLTHLRAENNHIRTNMNLVNQLHLNMASENSVLRAQISELTHRLQALTDIISCMSSKETTVHQPSFDDQIEGFGGHYDQTAVINGVDHDFLNPWSFVHVNQPIMASPDIFMY